MKHAKTQRLASLLGGAVRRPAGVAAAGGRHSAAQPRQLRSSLRQAAKSQSGVPVRLPKAADQCTVLLCVADETPGFVLAYLNAGQNCIHLLAMPAVLEVPFGGKNVPLADCYAAAGPARCREALGEVFALPEDTDYLAIAPAVLTKLAARYGAVRVGFTGALTPEQLARYGKAPGCRASPPPMPTAF